MTWHIKNFILDLKILTEKFNFYALFPDLKN